MKKSNKGLAAQNTLKKQKTHIIQILVVSKAICRLTKCAVHYLETARVRLWGQTQITAKGNWGYRKDPSGSADELNRYNQMKPYAMHMTNESGGDKNQRQSINEMDFCHFHWQKIARGHPKHNSVFTAQLVSVPFLSPIHLQLAVHSNKMSLKVQSCFPTERHDKGSLQ